MGFLDIEDVDDIYDEEFVEEETNRYLANAEDAVSLISKILPISREKYFDKKRTQKLDTLIDVRFLSMFKQFQLKDEAQLQMKLSMLSDKLTEQNKYNILKNNAVVGIGGKFSAGKSKFINSLLKADNDFLPEDQNPTTSISTYITKGEKEEINAYTYDNRKVLLDAESLQALTHKFYEKYRMGFSYFIKSLVIELPKMPYSNLIFLDTPGYSKADVLKKGKNQKDLSDENKAYTQLRSVDYVIWLVDIENGVLSESDIKFINKLNLENPLLIVINKSDKKTDSQIKSIVEMVETTAKAAGINLFAVTAYSSRDNVEWNNNGYINAFLWSASRKKIKNDDIISQISNIENMVLDEIDEMIKQSIKERNDFSKIIFKSNDVFEIKTLVSLYSELLSNIAKMTTSKNDYLYFIKLLNNVLNNQCDGGNKDEIK